MTQIFDNAVASLRLGIEDFETGSDDRMLSAARNYSIFPSPFCLERIELSCGLFGGHGPVDRAQIDGDGLAVFPSAEVQGMTHQMHDTGLD